MSLSGTTAFTITASPNVDSLYTSSPYNLKFNVVLADYTSVTGTLLFTVVVNRYICVSGQTYNIATGADPSATYTY